MRGIVILAWLLALAAGLTFAWAGARPASLEPAAAPGPAAAVRPLQGAPIDATPESEAGGHGRAMAEFVEGAEIDFERLVFDDYDPPGLRAQTARLGPSDFPVNARLLDGKQLAIIGFTLALELDAGLSRQLMVSRYPPGCCFGTVPVFDEWVLVELDEPVDVVELAGLVRASGTLVVGEALLDSGAVECLYRLTAATVEAY